MVKISFLILHYKNIKDTEECIDSILKNINYNNYNIVVVDNGSNDGTGEKIQKKYQNLKNFDILINKDNLGFSKGNNTGFKYIKKFYNSDFIIMINNDTLIKDSDFINKIILEYKINYFDILGPKIISLIDNKNQNPVLPKFDNIKKVRKGIIKYKILLFLNFLFLETLVKKIIKKITLNKKNHSKNIINNYMLHGSCLIFSKDYIEKYDGLFNDTFMYGEEDILYYISKRDNLKLYYSNKLTIYHKEDSSTNFILKRGRVKRRFIYKNSIKSLKILKKLMEE